MTFIFFGYRITLFRFERLERFTVQIDHAQRKADADAIKNTKAFSELKERARNLRMTRAGTL